MIYLNPKEVESNLINVFLELPNEDQIKGLIENQFNYSFLKLSSEISIFKKLYDKLHQNNQMLKNIIQNNEGNSKKQVSEYLKYLRSAEFVNSNNLRDRNARERYSIGKRDKLFVDLLDLFSKIILNEESKINWTKLDIEYFIHGLEMLSSWNYFFFSYTPDDGARMNEDFSSAIRNSESNNLMRHNLAHSIYKSLERIVKIADPGRDCFFAKNLTSNKGQIGLKAQEQIEKSFSFVQLIEDRSFVGEPYENLCLQEYSCFKNSSGRIRPRIESEGVLFLNTLTKRSLKRVIEDRLYSDWAIDVSNATTSLSIDFKTTAREIDSYFEDWAEELSELIDSTFNQYLQLIEE